MGRGVTMTSSHKISFSIIDILDPKKFNSKRANELCVTAEKFPVPNAEGSGLESDGTAGGDFRIGHAEAGKLEEHLQSTIRLAAHAQSCISCARQLFHNTRAQPSRHKDRVDERVLPREIYTN